MCNPRKPLSNRVPWAKLAGELDIHARTLGLPCSTQCPVCRGLMRVYADRVLGGEWYCCPGCNRQGDMIELAAAVWGFGIPETISRLRRLGFDLPGSADDLQAYVERHVQYRRRVAALWADARCRFDDRVALVRLAHRLNLVCDAPYSRLDAPAALLRGSDIATAERCFAPGSMKHADVKRQQGNPSQHALFRGRGWGEVLMVPFFGKRPSWPWLTGGVG